MSRGQAPIDWATRTERLLRSMTSCLPIRRKVVIGAASGRERLPADLEAQEKVALLAVWCAGLGFSRTLERLPVLSLAELGARDADIFFNQLERAVADLDRAGMDQVAADLSRVGQLVAGSLQLRDVEHRLDRISVRRLGHRLRDLPFLPQRGR